MRLSEGSPQSEPIRNCREKREAKRKTQKERTGARQNSRVFILISYPQVSHESPPSVGIVSTDAPKVCVIFIITALLTGIRQWFRNNGVVFFLLSARGPFG